MGRRLALVILGVFLVSSPAQAIQLHWSTGADTLGSMAATRCTLLVQPSGLEQVLPAEWTLS